MKKNKSKYLFHILSFLIPILIILINFIFFKLKHNNIKLISSSEILIADMKTQYVSLMHYFRNVLHGKDSILYSFSNSLGGNMFATYAYYLSSPLNILLIFANGDNITHFIFAFILIKIGLSGLTMYIYLNNKINSNKVNALIISIYYSLMAYNVSYYFNIMWLDIVYFLPLVLIGIDDIVKKQKINKYVIFLSLAIISNFYIGYMLCIFCCLYFLYEMIINYSTNDKDKIIKCIKIFILSSVIVGMICSWLLIPTILDMENMIRSPLSQSMYIRKNLYENFLLFLSKLFALPNSSENVLSKYTPNVYYGLLPLLLSFTYFYGNDKLKNKIVAIIMIAFFVLSFSTNSINLFWHGFSFPNGYAYRFSFLFSFFMLLLAYKSLSQNEKLKVSKFIILVCLLIFVGCTQINDGSNICFNYLNIIITIAFIILYYIFINLKDKHNKIISIIMYLCIVIELVILVNNSFITTSKLDYDTDYSYYLDVMCKDSKKLKDINYKIDNQFVFSVLDSFSCSDYRLSGALTTNNGDLYQFLHNTGFIVTYSTVTNNYNTPIIYSLLGIDYYYDLNKDNTIEKIKYYYDDKEYDDFYLHYNKYALPYGYMIDDNFQQIYSSNIKSNPFEYQNAILKSMSGILESCLKPYKLEKLNETTYELTVDNDKDIYVYLKHDIPENDTFFAELNINGEVYEIDAAMSGVFKIDNHYKDKTIEVEITSADNYYYENDDIIYFYYLDYDTFEKQIEKIKESSFVVIKKEMNKLEGKINVEKNGTLFLSIPYEKGFKIYVDGKKVDYYKLYDAFIGIDIKEGIHSIQIKFISPGLKLGVVITALGLILFGIWVKKFNK